MTQNNVDKKNACLEEKIKKEADLNGGISIKRSLCSVVIDAGMSEK